MTSPIPQPAPSLAAVDAFRALTVGEVVHQRRFVAGPTTAHMLAGAAVRARFANPNMLISLVVMIVAAALWIATSRDPGPVIDFVVVFVLLMIVTPFLQRGRYAKAMEARGFGAGQVTTIDYYADSFLVCASVGISRYRFADLLKTRRFGGNVVVGVRTSQLLLVLPAELAAGPLLGS